jgi:hypothetical protein
MPASASAIRAGRAFVELFAEDSSLVRTLKANEKRLKDFGANIRNVGLGLAAIGAAIIAPLAIACVPLAPPVFLRTCLVDRHDRRMMDAGFVRGSTHYALSKSTGRASGTHVLTSA